jgi:calcineurin-like phosphoesterase family protein
VQVRLLSPLPKEKMLRFDPDKTFFTGDTHFGHKNIIKYAGRPFECSAEGVKKHDEELIRRWNSKVPEDADVIVLGDFCFAPRKEPKLWIENILAQLNGRIWLVEGNHDHRATRSVFKDVGRMLPRVLEVKVGDRVITLNHFAQYVWPNSHFGSWHLYGHSHAELPLNDQNPFSFDVGVDAQSLYPLSFEEVEETMWQVHIDVMKWEIPKEAKFGGGLLQRELYGQTEEEWIAAHEGQSEPYEDEK